MAIIDSKTGDLKFDAFSLRKHAPMVELENLIAKNAHAYSAQQLLALGSHQSEEKLWGLGAAMRNGRVMQFWLQDLKAKVVAPEKWTIANEVERQKAHHDYLKSIFKDPDCRASSRASNLSWQFSWGSVSSELDLKGVQALIIIDYLL